MEYKGEKELVERLQAGDQEAFGKLYESYQTQAYRTAVFLTGGNRTEAQDVVQDSFVTVYQNIGSLKEPAAFRSWFYRILTNNAYRSIRKRKREILQEGEEISGEKADDKEDIPDILCHREEQLELWQCINGMDEKHRLVLVLYYYNEFSVKEIARIIDCMEGTVKSRLYHGRKLLEKMLSQNMTGRIEGKEAVQ